MRDLINQVKTGLYLLLLFSVICGLIYPLIITGFAQLIFPWKANGSLIEKNKLLIGSEIIGQSFTESNYFWGRSSATKPFPYNAAASSGSNFGPSNPNFLSTVNARAVMLKQIGGLSHLLIPVDLVTASGSGLDPDISPVAAFYQVPRIAKARGISEQAIKMLIKQSTKHRILGILGEERVNILELNLALDRLFSLKETL